jgi:predicted acetyltransferase
MEIDLRSCKIVTLPPGDRKELYRFLGRIFEVERALFEKLARGEISLYHWNPYTAILDGQIIGNLSLVDMRVWIDGEIVDVTGFASVATHPDFRGKGVAKFLMKHCLEKIDAGKQGGVLFTGTPAVYQSSGFQIVEQGYQTIDVDELTIESEISDFEITMVESLDSQTLRSMSSLYSCDYPNYNGKLVRDEDYWAWYRQALAISGKNRIVLCCKGAAIVGCARIEEEKECLLLDECCCDPTAKEVTRTLLKAIVDFAKTHGYAKILLALPENHFLRAMLDQSHISLKHESGAVHEAFMVRSSDPGLYAKLSRLRWCLADKF